MNWLKNLKITEKILFFIIIGIFSCLSISFSGFYFSYQESLRTEKINVLDVKVTQKLSETIFRFNIMDKSLMQKVIAPTKETIRKYDLELNENIKNFEESLNSLEKYFYTEKSKALYINFLDSWKKYKLDLREIQERAETVEPELIEQLKQDYDNKFTPKTNEILYNLQKINDFNSNIINDSFEESKNTYKQALLLNLIINILAISFFIIIGIYIGKIIKQPIETIKTSLDKIAEGDLDTTLEYAYKDEISNVVKSLNVMISSLHKSKIDNDIQNWVKDGLNTLSITLSEQKDLLSLSDKAISFISRYLEVGMGALYIYDKDSERATLLSSYAFNVRDTSASEYDLKEGIIGQVAYEKQTIILKNIQRKERDIDAGLISEPPKSIYAMPLIYENELCGVIEFATLKDFDQLKITFLEQANKIVATMINSLQQNEKVQKLLLLTQEAQTEAQEKADQALEANIALEGQKKQLLEQAEEMRLANIRMEEQQLELTEQAEEMRIANTKMEEQQEVLKQQAEEMRIANAKMEEQQQVLEQQAEEMRIANAKMEEQQQVLEQQAEEMRIANAKMEEQHQEMEQQSEELNQTNKKLMEQQDTLKEEQSKILKMNDDLILAQNELNKKAEQLAQSSQYKSEFLANMSHELRTPLNSVILLSQLLAKNKKKNLQQEEVEKLNVINKAGKDLLNLINDILDLSKIEAGKLNIELRDFNVNALLEDQEHYFSSIANEKGLKLIIENEFDNSLSINSDSHRIGQILRNFMSNAFKFTKSGSVTLKLSKSNKKDKPLRFSVIDTGIGIPTDKQKLVFEAFSQADGSTTRLYGGTGLGLSISVNLAKLLGGEITLESEDGKGSNFSLFLPYNSPDNINEHIEENHIKTIPPKENKIIEKYNKEKTQDISAQKSKIFDDKSNIKVGDKIVLIVEDDVDFANSVSFTAKEMGLKSLVALTCHDGMELVKKYKPTCVILDLGLPDKNGMELLREMKSTHEFRSIPVHIVSGDDTQSIKAKKDGAIGFQMKPATEDDLVSIIRNMTDFQEKKDKKVLIVEDNRIYKENIMEIFSDKGIIIEGAESEEEAREKIDSTFYDTIIIDLYLGNGSGKNVCKYIKEKQIQTPVIVHTGKDLTSEEEAELKKVADSIILKTVNSSERLLDEVSMFLHVIKTKKPEETTKYITEQKNTDAIKNPQDTDLEGKKILVVDDDIKNIFVLTSALEETNADILTAKNGREGVDLLKNNPDTCLVIMDIMMPVMNGYEAIEEIRNTPELKAIPIIAATAKAMKDDREKCIDAGANDYITKPIDLNLLIAMVEKWIIK
ncbi:MAG: response regulator [Candidatus Sericytochromatia bacterium]